MHKQLPTWQLIQQSLQHNIAVMLLYVLESKGSSPGRQGFMMAVNVKGEMSGTLGGGIMEHKFVEMAKARLQQGGDEVSVHHQIHDKSVAKNQSGMICSGEQTIFLYTVKVQELDVVNRIIASLVQNKNATLQLTPGGIHFSNDVPFSNYQFNLTGECDFLFTEKTGYKNTLIIIGGGHCSLALAQLMSGMDFYIHLFDHREGLNTMEQNIYVHEKHILNDYAELRSFAFPPVNCFVVVMTVGYRTDAAVLRALEGKSCTYLGVLGSKNKINTMFAQLEEEGMNKVWLKQLNAPTGVSIKSQTTEEIAVSIAAEIIAVKNR